MHIHTRSVGHTEHITEIIDRVPEFDPRTGDHFWCLFTMFKVDPEKALKGDILLDHESMVSVQGPGCYFCEQLYTPLLAKRRCKGHG